MIRTSLVTVLALAVLAVAFSGCASTGAGSAAADVPAAPQKKAFVPPSYEAAEYASEEYGFSVHYPSDFQEQPGAGLFAAASASQIPRIDITLIPGSPDASPETIASGLEAGLAELGGGEANVTASKETVLQDGVTPALELMVDWSFQGFPISSIVLITEAGGQMINVQVTTMEGGVDDRIKEIAYTLYLD